MVTVNSYFSLGLFIDGGKLIIQFLQYGGAFVENSPLFSLKIDFIHILIYFS